jgi:lipoate-protein ligase A
MYAVIISLIRKPELRSIEAAHCFVLSQMRAALRKLGHAVEIAGISDLALLGRKVSGNSLRCKRDALLYHGTLLYQCPIDLLARCLRSPPRQPDYRQHRSHDEFLANLGGDREGIERAIVEVWRPEVQLDEWPQAAVAQLVRERYSQHEWNFRH